MGIMELGTRAKWALTALGGLVALWWLRSPAPALLLGIALGWLGWQYVLFGIFAGFLYGAVIGMALMALRVRTRKQHIPIGPFLAAGTLTVVLVGSPIIRWYSGF